MITARAWSGKKYAVLGLLSRRPTYGYALMQQLRRWAIDPTAVRTSSVYTALSRLEDDLLIEPRGPAAASGTDRQPRITYGTTAAGEARLEKWLATLMTLAPCLNASRTAPRQASAPSRSH